MCSWVGSLFSMHEALGFVGASLSCRHRQGMDPPGVTTGRGWTLQVLPQAGDEPQRGEPENSVQSDLVSQSGSKHLLSLICGLFFLNI